LRWCGRGVIPGRNFKPEIFLDTSFVIICVEGNVYGSDALIPEKKGKTAICGGSGFINPG